MARVYAGLQQTAIAALKGQGLPSGKCSHCLHTWKHTLPECIQQARRPCLHAAGLTSMFYSKSEDSSLPPGRMHQAGWKRWKNLGFRPAPVHGLSTYGATGVRQYRTYWLHMHRAPHRKQVTVRGDRQNPKPLDPYAVHVYTTC